MVLFVVFIYSTPSAQERRRQTPQPTLKPRAAQEQPVKTYDLEVTWVKVIKEDNNADRSPAQELTPGAPFTVSFQVDNKGQFQSPPAIVTITFLHMRRLLFSRRMSIGEIEPGKAKTYRMEVTLAMPQSDLTTERVVMKASVTAQRAEGFSERNAANNELSKEYAVSRSTSENLSRQSRAENRQSADRQSADRQSADRQSADSSDRRRTTVTMAPKIEFQVKVPSASADKWVDSITIVSNETLTFRFVPHNIVTTTVKWEISDEPFKDGGKSLSSKWENKGNKSQAVWFTVPESGKMVWFTMNLSEFLPDKPPQTAKKYYTRMIPAVKESGMEQTDVPGTSNEVIISFEAPSQAGQKFNIPEKDILAPPHARRWKTDFNGDKKDDIIAFDRKNGNVTVSLSSGESFLKKGDIWQKSFCSDTEIPAMGDFNGDDKTDIISFARCSTDSKNKAGDVTVAYSKGDSFHMEKIWLHDFCTGGKIPAVGDFNGDGKDDIAFFVGSTQSGDAKGDVHVALSSGSGFSKPQKWHDWFCNNQEIPLVGDFDGDGKDDIASFGINTRQDDSTIGDVYVALSTGSSFSGKGEKWIEQFCYEKYALPLIGDFNGDGKDDIASVRRGSPGGEIKVAISTGRFGKSFAAPKKWHDYICAYDEIPLAGDFNGDSIDDIAVFSHDAMEGIKRGDVNVALSTGVEFNKKTKWHDCFCTAPEVPSTFAALYPYLVYLKNGELYLQNLQCIKTESSGADKCKLCIYADGALKHELKKDMNNGQSWPIDLKIPFNRNAKIELWDLDSPDPDDHLGTVFITLSDKAGKSIKKKMVHDEADYTIDYSLVTFDSDKRRQNAMDALESFEKSSKPGKFTKIDKTRLINEIRARIDKPTIMRQEKQGLCGPVTILVALAMKDPERYVNVCRSLYETGEFKAYGETIKPGSHLYTASVPLNQQGTDQMPHAEWMAAASLRDHENVLYDFDAGDNTAAGTTGAEMEHWMKTIIGCRNADFISNYSWGEKAALGEARQALDAGNIVALLVDGDRLPKQGPPGINWLNHVVLLLDVSEVGDITQFRIFTWGQEMDLVYSTDSFEDFFWGAVFGYY
ncbi:MAG: FG-GAP-like repeat-containing protein [Vulcanimicrobiota bacterium]